MRECIPSSLREVEIVSAPTVTVCISTRNRSHLLPRVLGQLEQQTLPKPDFEVVIVDNGSTDDTWEVLQALQQHTSVELRIHRNPPGKGPAAGRNRAWRDGRGELCAFTDDDCTPTPTWLEHAVAAVATRKVVAAGRVDWPPSDNPRIGPFTRYVKATENLAMWGATANFVAHRSDLEAVGGFDEGFLNVAGEDTDLLFRILETGVDFAYLDDAVVYHPVEQAGPRGLIRDGQRWVDIPAIFAKHPQARDLLHRRLFWKVSHERLILALLGLAGIRLSPKAVLLILPWLHERTCRAPIAETVAERVVTLPAALVLDMSELIVMLRGSVKHKAVVL